MQIDKHFYYVATEARRFGESEWGLRGIDFYGGLSAATLQLFRGDVWFASQTVSHKLREEQFKVVHRNGVGYVLVVKECDLPAFPCMVSTDPEVAWKRSCEVLVTTSDGTWQPSDCPPEGLALCGRDWLGVLRPAKSNYWLDAYAAQSSELDLSGPAYCPEWNESLEEPDAMRFQLSAIAGE